MLRIDVWYSGFDPGDHKRRGMYAGGVLRVGQSSLQFVLDLSVLRIAEYERQWREATDRLVRGATATAFLTAYRADGIDPYRMWGLWRDDGFVYVQEHVVVPADCDTLFDPWFPDPHVGTRVAAVGGVPFPEWRIELIPVLASAFGIRWTLHPK
jgi:CdiI N-terminal domain